MKTSTAQRIRAEINSSFDFTCDLHPLFGPHGRVSPFFTMWRSDTLEQVGGAVKDGYVPHNVDDVCVLAEAAASAFDDDKIKVDCYWTGNSHDVVIKPSAEYRASIANDKDAVWPRLHIRAGYGTSFRASLGLYRDACRNLMFPKLMANCSKSIFHTANLRPRIDSLAEDFEHLVSNWDNMVDTFRAMSDKHVKFEDFVTSIFGAGLKADGSELTSQATKRTEQLMLRMMRERESLGLASDGTTTVSVWEALNAVQGYIQHDTNRRGSMTELARSIIALEDARVLKAYSVALNLAS